MSVSLKSLLSLIVNEDEVIVEESLSAFLHGLTVHFSRRTPLRRFYELWAKDIEALAPLSLYYLKNKTSAWRPVVPSTRELEHQLPWSNFYESFKMEEDEESRALNLHLNNMTKFSQLSQLPIWSEIYRIFGTSTLSFIFSKCLLVLSRFGDVKILIGHPSSPLFQTLTRLKAERQTYYTKNKASKFSKFNTSDRENPYKLQIAPYAYKSWKKRRLENKRRYAKKRYLSSSGSSILPPSKIPRQESTDSKFKNYQLINQKTALNKETIQMQSSLATTSQIAQTNEKTTNSQIIIVEQNSTTLSENSQIINLKTVLTKEIVQIQSSFTTSTLITQTNEKTTNSEIAIAEQNSTGPKSENLKSSQKSAENRWLLSKRQKIYAIFDEIRSSKAEKSSVSKTSESKNVVKSVGRSLEECFLSKTPIFICVLPDKYFKKDLWAISKEVYKINPTLPLPDRLKGLKLNTVFYPQLKNNELCEIIILRISESSSVKFKLTRSKYHGKRAKRKKKDFIIPNKKSEGKKKRKKKVKKRKKIEMRRQIESSSSSSSSSEEDEVELMDVDESTNSLEIIESQPHFSKNVPQNLRAQLVKNPTVHPQSQQNQSSKSVKNSKASKSLSQTQKHQIKEMVQKTTCLNSRAQINLENPAVSTSQTSKNQPKAFENQLTLHNPPLISKNVDILENPSSLNSNPGKNPCSKPENFQNQETPCESNEIYELNISDHLHHESQPFPSFLPPYSLSLTLSTFNMLFNNSSVNFHSSSKFIKSSNSPSDLLNLIFYTKNFYTTFDEVGDFSTIDLNFIFLSLLKVGRLEPLMLILKKMQKFMEYKKNIAVLVQNCGKYWEEKSEIQRIKKMERNNLKRKRGIAKKFSKKSKIENESKSKNEILANDKNGEVFTSTPQNELHESREFVSSTISDIDFSETSPKICHVLKSSEEIMSGDIILNSKIIEKETFTHGKSSEETIMSSNEKNSGEASEENNLAVPKGSCAKNMISVEKTGENDNFLAEEMDLGQDDDVIHIPDENENMSNETFREINLRKQLKGKIQNFVPPSIVLSILSQIFHCSNALFLIGSQKNRRHFFRFLKKSIFLAGRYSALHFSSLMSGLDPYGVPWLSGIEDLNMKLHLLAKVMFWLFDDFLLNLIRAGFYVTETGSGRFGLVFYYKKAWNDMELNYLMGQETKNIIQRVELKDEFKEDLIKIRLIPKSNDLRSILSLRSRIVRNKGSIVLLLNFLTSHLSPRSKVPLLRSFWTNFVEEWKEAGFQKLYYVRADIKTAFTSVNIEKLCEILRELVRSISGNVSIKNLQTLVKVEKELKLANLKVLSTTTGSRSKENCENICHKYVLNIRKDEPFDAKEIVEDLISFISSKTYVKIRRKIYDFVHGLPQGSCFSQALCSIYYGKMEDEFLKEYLNEPGEFFFRSVDDYIFISPSKTRVLEFYSKLRNALKIYGATLRFQKSQTNANESDINVNQNKEEWVNYCGWRFCISNGHVARDFSTYAQLDISSTVTYDLTKFKNPESFVESRVCNLVSLRLKYLLFDPSFNCEFWILKNIHDGALMMAFRFYAILRVVYPKLSQITHPKRSSSLSRIIHRFSNIYSGSLSKKIEYLKTHTISHPCRKSPSSSSSHHGDIFSKIGNLREVIQYIVFSAFSTKLKRHHRGELFRILNHLNRVIRDLEKKLGKESIDSLDSVLNNENMPQYFKNIKI